MSVNDSNYAVGDFKLTFQLKQIASLGHQNRTQEEEFRIQEVRSATGSQVGAPTDTNQ